MPTFAPALGASLLWLAVQPIISSAVRGLPRGHERDGMLVGLLVAMASGTVALTVIVAFRGGPAAVDANPASVLAGLLTYPVATSLFYVAAYAFGARAELASQFSRVKPLFTFAAASLLFHEPFVRGDAWAMAFVVVGVVAMMASAARGGMSWPALTLGMGAALAWAAGEAFVKAGYSSGHAFQDTWFSLAVATVAFAAVMPLLVRDPRGLLAGPKRWLLAFAAHGVLSFAFAYALFFRSIAVAGLGVTIVLTAFWPVLSLFLAWGMARRRSERYPVTPSVWAASALLVAGSIMQALAMRG